MLNNPALGWLDTGWDLVADRRGGIRWRLPAIAQTSGLIYDKVDEMLAAFELIIGLVTPVNCNLAPRLM